MRWMNEYHGSAWSLIFVALAAVTLLISGVTLLVGHFQRQRSSPSREVILRAGLCVVAVWPLLLAGGFVWQSMPTDPASLQLAMPIEADPVVVNHIAAAEPVALPVVAPALTESPSESIPWSPETQIELPVVPVVTPSVASPLTDFFPAQVSPPAEELPNVSDPVLVSAPPTVAPSSKTTTVAFDSVPTPRQRVWPSWPNRLDVAFMTAWPWLCVVWGIGTVIAGLTLWRDLIGLRRMRRQFHPCVDDVIAATLTQAMQSTGLHRRPELFLSDQIGSPCTSGVRRPILILPQSMLDPDEYDQTTLLGVLTHECAHIVRRDVAWSLLARVIQSVYWWEPGLRRIVRQLSHVREEICDNYVLSSSVDARVYAKVLVDFAERPLFRPVVGVIGMVGNDNPLANRVERLLQETPDLATGVKWRSKWGVAVIVLLGCGMIGVVAACAEISKSLSQVAFSEAPKPVDSFASIEDNSRTVPIESVKSPVQPEEAAAEKAVEVSSAGAANFDLGTSTEATAGVSSDARKASPFDSPEAGSGTVVPLGDLPSDLPSLSNEFAPAQKAPDPRPRAPSQAVKQYVPVTRTVLRPVKRSVIVDGRPTEVVQMVSVQVVEMVPVNDSLDSSSDPIRPSGNERVAAKPQVTAKSFTLPKDPALSCGDKVALVVTLPEGENRLPKRVIFEGLTVSVSAPEADRVLSAEPDPLELGITFPEITPAAAVPAAAPSGEATTTELPIALSPAPIAEASPPAPAAEAVAAPAAVAPSTPETVEVLLSGPATIFNAWESLQARGAATTVIKALTPTPETEKPSPLDRFGPIGGKSAFRIDVEALSDDKGQFRALSCWGRELDSSSDKKLTELTALLTLYKSECLKVAGAGKAIPPVVFDPVRSAVVTIPLEPFPHQPLEESALASEVLQLFVGVQVFNEMRYGDVQSIGKACRDLTLIPLVMNDQNDCSNCPTPLRVFASAELTMVYDKQGKPVGQHAVLLAEKSGTDGVQVITESQVDTLLAAFAGRHARCQATLILTDDPDLPLPVLLNFIVRANRAGISVVQRSQLEELRLRETDLLVPLLNDAPLKGTVPTHETRWYDEGLAEPNDLDKFQDSRFAPASRTRSAPDPILMESGLREI